MGFKEKDAHIHAFKKKTFGMVSKGTGNFYKGLMLIDCSGNMYKVTNASLKGPAPLFISLRFLQPMNELNIQMEPTGNITLDELKQKVFQHIKNHPRTFEPLYNGEPWSKRIDAFNSFKELIDLFH